MLKLIKVNPCEDPHWQQLVETHPSSVFHSPAWLQVLAATYDFEPEAYVLLNDQGQAQAGIPFCRIRDLRGERLVSLPFSDYCDPLVWNAEIWQLLAAPLLAEQCDWLIRPLHNPIPVADPRLERVNQARWHGLDLQPSEAELWQGLDESAKRAIRKAERMGVSIRLADHPQDLRSFFELHLNTRKAKYQLLTQPYAFFEQIWQRFIEQQRGILMLAMHQEQVIGATLFLEWQKCLFYKFNTSSAHHLALRPNDLMIWSGIRYAKSRGLSSLDFGLSDWDQEGLVRYKRKFASEEKTISFLRYRRHVSCANSNHDAEVKQLLTHLTELLTETRVPNPITEAGGALLYRFFT